MLRTIIEWFYLKSAEYMPLRWEWSCVYLFRARAYFETRDAGALIGWPWNWSVRP